MAQQPLNNVARVAIETLAAVLGGVQTIATSSYDEAYSIPTEEAATVALRTQQIVAHEAGVTGTVDALGGSYAIECLTDALEGEVQQYLDKIDTLGGAVRCIENGFYHRELSEAAYQYQRQIETEERILVGLNAFQSEEEQKIPVFKGNPETERRQIERVQVLREQRDNAQVKQSLSRSGRGGSGERKFITRTDPERQSLCHHRRNLRGAAGGLRDCTSRVRSFKGFCYLRQAARLS